MTDPDITRQEIELKQAHRTVAMRRAEALRVRSSFDGVFLAPLSQDLPGRYAKRGDVLGYVVFEQSRIVRVVITQDDNDLVRNRLRAVEVRLTHRPSDTYAAKVVREVPGASNQQPNRAFTESGGGRLAADPRDSGQLKTLRARREVLLSAGALQSPQILMLSGIGAGAQLQRFGIATVHDLPGVGQHLHDHVDLVQVVHAPQLTDLFGRDVDGAAAVIEFHGI